ncbi:short transient receptor potential channel 4-associated protein-like isoform X1 [Haliotis rubra]|uniref:short transient receptor potential channel 4-associated protein-like isoform X1 n=1 Tax=Haliotis rufescens TaxID=6454 RepID=UPI001EB08705|nr:short transient receptor potential channel 4-associated protein-like isoform X1 [Haliotis rufescens]XP_046552855.1 short transient receptor potential channel 4-associated protein-like isoform X1 [Haliotis rubra]
MLRHKSQKGLSRKSIFQSYESWQYTGIGYTRISQLPPHILGKIGEQQEVAELIQSLDQYSVQLGFDCDECLKSLKKLLGKLMNFEPRRSQDEGPQDQKQDKFAVEFFELGGVDVLLRLLIFGSLFPHPVRHGKVIWESERMLRIKSLVLEILTKITTTSVGERVTTELMRSDDTLNYIFTLLAHQKTFVNACQLIEDMLQSRKEVLDLHRITNLRGLISCLDDVQLANFCRILAVVISDLDIYENKSSLFAQNKQKRSRGFVNLRDINQELLLGIPELLPRLVKLAIAKEYLFHADTPRYRGMVSELDCWMEWIENQMADELYETQTVDDFEEYIGGVSEPTTEGGSLILQQGLKITEELVQRVEVVYVLGLFLLGKHRKKVQRKLADLKLAPGLSELFDQFIWKCQVNRYHSRHRLRGHNAACECSPEVALKIQFLRLVHSFCDHSDYKHLLLSKNELNEVKRINAKAGSLALPSLENVNRSLMCRGSKGLLTKIVEVMKKEPTTSTFRFWLARAVESYLRGDTSYCDQVFLMRRGLLQHVATNIVEHEIRHKEILQSSFDLLGELVKFNIEAFKTFDTILNTQAKLDKFVATVNRNLVDSNMFIRSLVLSLEHFTNEDNGEYAKKDCKLLTYIGNFQRQMEYLYKLIHIINVQNLTQENVSCLNTTLVFLMFANQKNKLPQYLRALRDEKDDLLDVHGSSSVMQNFRDLLIFWQDHYLHKDKDCSALEKSSRISFSYWKKTVNMLVSEDKSQPTAVLHYVTPLSGDRNN